MAKKAQAVENKIRKLGPVFNTFGGSNTTLESAVSSRYEDIVLDWPDQDGETKSIEVLKSSKLIETFHPDALMIVLGAVTAMGGRSSKQADGAVLWLHENKEHPRVAAVLREEVSISWTYSTGRAGYAGIRMSGAEIGAVVDVLGPVMENASKEFGMPKADTRGSSEKPVVDENDYDFDFI